MGHLIHYLIRTVIEKRVALLFTSSGSDGLCITEGPNICATLEVVLTNEACPFCDLSYFRAFLVNAVSFCKLKCLVCNKAVHPIAVCVVAIGVIVFKSGCRSSISRSLPG